MAVAGAGPIPSGLLNDFVRLAHENLPEEAFPDSVIEQVVTFVRKWGPLWLCRTPEYMGHGRRCFWEPRQAIYWGGTTTLCSWRPVEEVYEFLREAREVKATIEALGELRRIRLQEENSQRLSRQMDALVTTVRTRLAWHGSLRLEMRWPRRSDAPKLHVVSKVGFIHVVWLEIAQLLCEAKGPLQCDNCRVWYFREGRRPKAGQHHYCPTCRENDRGAKHLSKQRERGEQKPRPVQNSGPAG